MADAGIPKIAPGGPVTRLEAIQQREQAATPGVWEAYPYWFKPSDDQPGWDLKMDGRIVTFEHPFSRPDATFIAAARADVPWLLARIDDLANALCHLEHDGMSAWPGAEAALAALQQLEV